MRATKCQLKFKGDVENYLSKSHNNIELIADRLLTLFNVKTIMGQCHIRKREGVHPADILFLLIIIPLLKLKTVHSFCQYKIEDWAGCGKDTFYRFKCKAYPWRTFISKIVIKYFYLTDKNKPLRGPQEPEERYFIFDDTGLPKRGNKIQNVSFSHDHTKGRSTLGFCVLNLGLLTDAGFCPLDFAYRFGQKRHPKSPAEIIGDKRSISGQRSHEAKHMKKTELALDMLGRAIKQGHKADYALFDSWFSSPIFISKIRALYNAHAICRIKINNTYYEEPLAKLICVIQNRHSSP
ncbi:MAG: transposase [Deltaproteobacteria bacterium]|nr:transposase [Deltaproteobacteria bacterium]